MTCSICASIPDVVVANTGRGDYLGPPTTLLERNKIESSDDLRECPECHAVFVWHDETAQTGSGNNDEEVLTRVPPAHSPLVHAFLHRGERPAEEAAADAPQLAEVPDDARALLLTHLLRRDHELAARLVPWMLDQVDRADRRWAVDFLTRFAVREGATLVMSELARRSPSPNVELLRAHCRRELCSLCLPISTYRTKLARRELPAPISSLVQLGASDDLDLWECPECDSMFAWESKKGSEGSLWRKSDNVALALRACIHRKGPVSEADVKLVFATAAAQVLLVYGMRHDRELVRQLMPAMVAALVKPRVRRGRAVEAPPWIHDILRAFVDGDRGDAQAVLTEIERAPARDQRVEELAARCRGAIQSEPR